ncbi:MAG: ABC transporter ATP-binding protein [Planctomycetes bacterium]|nr:ABC transporter ATP-binding protein [Planctomycetota bacterium]
MIELTGLTKVYDSFTALSDVSFRVDRGDIFGFIGPNGAGKTTTIRILATLLDPTHGSAMIDGLSVVEEPEAVRRVIGYMPDDYGAYDGISVWEYLDFFAGAYKVPRRARRRVLEAVMELTDLDGLRHRLVVELSKGMRQRLCLAKTLVHDPKVLILDEPASGLDPRARIEFRVLLKELREMGKTIFISSHILTELSDVCTKVAILERGKLVASGEIAEIVKALTPHQTVIVRVQGAADKAVGLLRALPFVTDVEARDGELRARHAGDADIPLLVRRLAENDVPILGVSEEKMDLEDVFMRITKGEVA